MARPSNESRRLAAARKRVESGWQMVTCLECGLPGLNLASHISRIHGLSRREYLFKHNLELGTKLVAPIVIENSRKKNSTPKQREFCRKLGISRIPFLLEIAKLGGKEASLRRMPRSITAAAGVRLNAPEIRKKSIITQRMRAIFKGLAHSELLIRELLPEI